MTNNNRIKILLAEDDVNLGALLKDFLELKDYHVELFADGESAGNALQKNKYDLCIFDVMMPKKDGFTLAKELRKIDSRIPIIFLTARSMQNDKIEGLKLGADDYITKPFNTEELLLRISSILRRSIDTPKEFSKTHFAGIEFDALTQILKLEKKSIQLSTKESELLKLLVENKNNIVERNRALNMIWHDDSYFASRSMDVYISKLRSYFKNNPQIEILNIHGKGFKFIVKE
ncbi:MAG: response regulator transcription factor [Ignavibacteriales bacterium]